MKKITAIIIMLALLVAAFILNPDHAAHIRKTSVGNINTELNLDDNELTTSMIGKVYRYNNYYLFSTTTNSLTGQRATFGIFGVVFN